jgi:hypothetical protein
MQPCGEDFPLKTVTISGLNISGVASVCGIFNAENLTDGREQHHQ